jgi:TonB family protein
MDTALLLNLLAYSAQIACIVLAGCALPALLRLDAPGVRFVYWRALVVFCLALPWIQAKQAVEAVAAVDDSVIPPFAGSAPAQVISAAGAHVNWPFAVAVVISAGILLRLIWMAAGLFYLRRLRSAGSTTPDDGERELQQALGTRAEVRYVPGLTQPVTFGMRRPVVLLPDSLREQSFDIQRAVLAHELVHVQRRDWVWIVGEELVRAALWFHPAMWWLISRVQLAREEVVDETVVTLTGKRKTYVEALLAFADTTPLSPAPAFARRRHLFRRMVLISKEAVMSSTRVVVSCAVMAIVVAGGGWYAVDAFPMQQGIPAGVMSGEPGPLEKSARPITPENPIPRRLVSTAPDYPAGLLGSGARGTVALRITLDATGRVAEVRPASVTARAELPQFSIALHSLQPDARERLLGMQLPAKDVAAAMAIIDGLTRAAVDAVRRWSYDAPADAPISFMVAFSFMPDTPTTSVQPAPPTERTLLSDTPHPVQWAADGAVRVGGNVKVPIKIRDVKPVYPADAQAARVQGVVIVEVRIEPDGTVSNARILRSVSMLDQAALEAVLQWQFVPTLLNGQAVPVIMTCTVNFTLM